MLVFKASHDRRLFAIVALLLSSIDIVVSQGCTADVFECPDGSLVVRVPPDCEFQECPQTTCTSDVFTCPDGSTVGRVPPDCEFADCPQAGGCTADVFTCPDGTIVARVPPECNFADCPPVDTCTSDVFTCPDGTVVNRVPPECNFADCPPVTDPPVTDPPVPQCTPDLFICPDGSEVIRDPDNDCNFFPCPETTPPVACPPDLFICDDGSEVVRDPENNCEFFACPEPIVCDGDVFECPDGSTVGRFPPDCNFADCPPVPSPPPCTSDVFQCPDGSFVGRVPPDCEFEDCPQVPCTSDTFTCPDGSLVGRVPPDCEFADCPPFVPGYLTLSAAVGGCIARKVKGSGGDELYLKSCSSDDENIQWRLDSMGRFHSKTNDAECMQAAEYPAMLVGPEALQQGTTMFVKECGGPLKNDFQKMQFPTTFATTQQDSSPTGLIRLVSRPDLCVVHFGSNPTIGESRIMLANCDFLGGDRGKGWTAEDPCMHVPFCD